jgi:hypothetical protein
MPGHHRPDPPAAPVPVPSLADHARVWDPSEDDPGLAIDRAINRARSIRRDDDSPPPIGEVVNAEADAWNARHPVGQAVIAFHTDETCYRGRTTTAACLMGGIPVVGLSVVGLSTLDRPAGYWPLSRVEPLNDPKADLPTATAAAGESERPGVLPVAPAVPGPRTKPDALAVLCHELGVELLALAEARRDGKSWDDGHWRRLRGAVEAAGVVLDAGPRPEGRT